MLELFKGKIPEIDKLIVLIQKKIDSPKYTLEDIKDVIYDHISEHKQLDKKADYDKAECTAFNVVNNLIDDLEVNVTNYNRIKEYLLSYHSCNGFNRLIIDFQMFLNKRELLHLIDHGTIIFGSDNTKQWKPIKEIVLTILKQDKTEKFADAYQRYKSNQKKK
jgi:6-pyruvoyl-tetrahydropterin synthase